MNFADQKMVRKLRKEFPVGCRIVLDEMDDRQAPPIGTLPTVRTVATVWQRMPRSRCRSTALVKRDRPAHVAPGAEQSLTATTISSRHSAEERTSRSATAAERRKH